MTIAPENFLNAIRAKNEIDAADTLALRKTVWPDGRITEREANMLFELNDASDALSREWIDFFVEAITEFTVNQVEPKGYMSDANAAWLMQRIDKDGKLDSLAELELMTRVMEKASNVPVSFQDYVLDQIETTVLTGMGPTRDGGAVLPGCVTRAEADYIRRIVFAAGGDGPAIVSRAEADMLFRVKDATRDGNNAPEWETLFVQGVGNHLMAHSDYQPLKRGDAAALEKFMNDNAVSVGGFLKRFAGSDLKNGFAAFFGGRTEKPPHEEKVAADRAIDAAEKDWLDSQIHADGTIDTLEKKLLAFIAEESGRAGL